MGIGWEAAGKPLEAVECTRQATLRAAQHMAVRAVGSPDWPLRHCQPWAEPGLFAVAHRRTDKNG